MSDLPTIEEVRDALMVYYDARVASADLLDRLDPTTQVIVGAASLARALHAASPESHFRRRCKARHDLRADAILAAVRRG